MVDHHFIIKEQPVYTELGGDFFDRLNEEYLVNRLKNRIQNLGYQILIKKEITA